MKRTRKDPTAWRTTPEGHAKYREARAAAQEKANELGIDVGLEANDLFRHWHTFLLPAKQHRFGHELRCEVVSPTNLTKAAPGHGPLNPKDRP